MYRYQFPKWEAKPLDEITIGQQVAKVNFECAELSEVMLGRDDGMKTCYALAEEAFDVIHSCETLLRKIELMGHDVNQVHADVIKKNRKRGYYGEHSD